MCSRCTAPTTRRGPAVRLWTRGIRRRGLTSSSGRLAPPRPRPIDLAGRRRVSTGATGTLRQRAARGAAWTLPTSVGSRAIGLLGTLVLARYLTPNEYGVVMTASIVATTASSVTTFGIGIYLVANAEISRSETFHATSWFLA